MSETIPVDTPIRRNVDIREYLIPIEKAAIEDAGFFVGELQLTGTWNQDEVERGVSFIWGGHTYQFISSKTPSVAKSFNCMVAGKGYLTDKSFKKLKNDYGAYLKLENNIIQLILVK